MVHHTGRADKYYIIIIIRLQRLCDNKQDLSIEHVHRPYLGKWTCDIH